MNGVGERGAPVVGDGVDIRAVVQQESDGFQILQVGGAVQSGNPVLADGVDIRAVPEEDAQNFGASRHGKVQGGVAVLVRGGDVGAPFQQHVGEFAQSESGSHEEDVVFVTDFAVGVQPLFHHVLQQQHAGVFVGGLDGVNQSAVRRLFGLRVLLRGNGSGEEKSGKGESEASGHRIVPFFQK